MSQTEKGDAETSAELDLAFALKSATLSIIVAPNTVSEVWRYFGKLANNQSVVKSAELRVYCIPCLNNGILKGYSKSVSTGNLHTHLQLHHKIESKTKDHAEKMQKLSAFFQGTANQVVKKDVKLRLARELTVWYCRDLLPFHTVAKDGFKEFCSRYSITNQEVSLPDQQTLGNSALNDVYNITLEKVHSLLQTVGELCMTMDMWTDSYKRISYITYTCHWIDDDWKTRDICLGTSPFSHLHTAEDIAEDIRKIVLEFKLQGRIFRVTAGGGSNIIKALRLVGLPRNPCVAHSLQSLIKKDCLGNRGADAQKCTSILQRLREMYRSVLYKYDELSDSSTEFAARITTIETVQLLQLDEQYHTSEVDDTTPFTTFQCDVPTRWNCILTMLRSFLNNQVTLELVLERHKLSDKILNTTEVQIILDFSRILEIFEIATDVLQASLYPSLYWCLLMRSEIEDRISEKEEDSNFTQEIKKILRNHFDSHFDVTADMLCAALLDPEMKRLNIIETCLNTVGESKLSFLIEMSKHHNKKEMDFPDSKDKGEKTDGGDLPAKRTKFEEQKSELLKKHSTITMGQSLESEIRKYFILAHNTDNVLDWWKINAVSFPNLAQLAKKFLCIPATSAPPERAFSNAGLVVTSMRAQLHPLEVRKVLFVHDNFKTI